jgi:DNA polymerase-3 subunit alpha
MNNSDFVHLHVHSDASFIDGAAKTAALAKRAKAAGHVALALTDHGTICGNIEFFKSCEKSGIKPILGCEAYLAPGLDDDAHMKREGRKDIEDDGSGKTRKKKNFDAYSHFTLLAKSAEGWRNLQVLSSIASIDGFYFRPRMSWGLLKKHSAGLIALSGCLSGEIADEVLRGTTERAEAHARRWKDLFGEDYFIELMPADENDDQAKVNDACLAVARKIGSKIVATADVHYVERGDAELQEIKICVNNRKTIEDNRATGLNMPPLYYYKTTEEMARSFAFYPEALRTTREIADKCFYDSKAVLPGKHGKYFMPQFTPPDGSDPVRYFRRLCRDGLIRRYGEPSWDHWCRLEYEMACIERMGFVHYFLVVEDFMTWARGNGVPCGPGRGSAAGSLASFCLGITNIDPLRYGLLFERFLNPSRISMPDIDLDFCEKTRWKVIEYVRRKYGEDCVGQIATFGVNKAKSAIKDVGRVLGYPLPEVNQITRLVPHGPKVDLKEQLQTNVDLQMLYENNPRAKDLLNKALQLLGFYRSIGRHAAGIVISDAPLIDRIALIKLRKNTHDDKEAAGAVITAWPMEQVEDVGLLKMDFLGLSTLTQIYDTVANIKETEGLVIDPDRIPVRDMTTMESTTGDNVCPIHAMEFKVCRCCDKTLDIYSRAEVNGVFQVESGGMRELLRDMQPDRFDDLVALVALYRPGPLGSGMHKTYVKRKNGEEPVEYEHPKLEAILKNTYGTLVFQEQIMQLSVALAGFTMPEADALRKATAKKKPEDMAKIRDKFVPGCIKHSGMSEEAVNALWDKIAFFSEYSFNCVAADSEVVDADTGEVVTIAELAKRGGGIRVHAIDDAFTVRKRRVLNVWSTGKRKTLELKTKTGKRIRATADHRFRTLGGWVKLEDLKPGDYIASARALQADGDTEMQRHEVVTLAGLLSEGNTCHPSTLYFTNKDSPELLEEFSENIAMFPNTVVRIEKKPNGGASNVVANMGLQARGDPAKRGQRSGAFEWAGGLGMLGITATRKTVPGVVFRLKPHQLNLFIGRLWSGDGYVGYTASPSRAAPFYATSSEVMAKQVQLLLSRLGIVSTIHHKAFKYRYQSKSVRESPKNSTPDVGYGTDAKGTYSLRSGWTVIVLGLESMRSFSESIIPEVMGYGLQKTHFDSLLKTFNEFASHDKVPFAVRDSVDRARRSAGITWDELESRSGVSMKMFCGNGPAKKGFSRSVMKSVVSALPDGELTNASSREVFWEEIADIVPSGECDTYDMEVEEDHNFAVNGGIIAHNCSHSAAYALISWHTAWLKANYPVEFLAALMTINSGVIENLARYVEEARRWGIHVAGPNVNESEARFKVNIGPGGEKWIAYGLDAVKGIGPETVAAIVHTRKTRGPFKTIDHFCSVAIDAIDSKVVEQLAKAGAFDSLGHRRSWLLTQVPTIVSKKKNSQLVDESPIDVALRSARRDADMRKSGQLGLFTDEERVIVEVEHLDDGSVPDWTLKQRLDTEREAIGFYLSGHPLDDYIEELRRYAREAVDIADEPEARIGGVVAGVRHHVDKRGQNMAFITFESTGGPFDVTCFSSVWATIGEKVKPGVVGFFVGGVDTEASPPKLLAKTFITLDSARSGEIDERPRVLTLYIWDDVPQATETFKKVREYLDSMSTGSGSAVVAVRKDRLREDVRMRKTRLGCRVDATDPDVIAEIRARLGAGGEVKVSR